MAGKQDKLQIKDMIMEGSITRNLSGSRRGIVAEFFRDFEIQKGMEEDYYWRFPHGRLLFFFS